MERCVGVVLGDLAVGPLAFDPLDLTSGVIPNANQLTPRGKQFFQRIIFLWNIDREVAILMALYNDKYAPMFPVFACTAIDIETFKNVTNPDHEWFDAIFRNVLQGNQTLQQKIADVQHNDQDFD